MAWCTRGTGRNYDSLSAFAALIGFLSKKVLDYDTEHRKCRMCDMGHLVEDHDCRLNFHGSAKSMEPKAAEKLALSELFKECHVQLGVFIADNDSSAILAVRNAVGHEVIKHSDKNHSAKGVKKQLYQIVKDHKELNSSAIEYLYRCFTYAVSQNEGKVAEMEAAIRNIPYHCFNKHENCGDWCGFHKDPDNYQHKVIGNGFEDLDCFEALKKLFDEVASKCHKFVAGVSSNANESLNAMVASKAPKSRFYGKSPSSDVRAAMAVLKKNDGEGYVSTLAEKLNLSPGTHTKKYSEIMDQRKEKNSKRFSTPTFKKRRLFLKQAKTKLRKKSESSEGVTYESNIDLLDGLGASLEISDIDSTLEPIIVYYDLETGGFAKTADILQIAAKCENRTFSVYVQPTQKIDTKASEVHGIRLESGNLYLHGKQLKAVSLSTALQQFYTDFLVPLRRKVILAAHNGKFDCPRLFDAIRKTYLTSYYQSVVYGFLDTLPIIRKINGSKTGGNKLTSLASNFGIPTEGAHDAIKDVAVLELVVSKFQLSYDVLIAESVMWQDAIKQITFNETLPTALKGLAELKDCSSRCTRRKIVLADITFEMIVEAYSDRKRKGLEALFGEDENRCVKVTKSKAVIKRICDGLDKLLPKLKTKC